MTQSQPPDQWGQGQGPGPHRAGYPSVPGQLGVPPQPPWPAPMPPKGGVGKWIAAAAVLAVVIAVTMVVTLHFSGGNSNSDAESGGAETSPSGIASANDTGPVAVITADPTCASWVPLATALSTAQSNGWQKRDPSQPATAWTPDLQKQYQQVALALRGTADSLVSLAKTTPHRVMRELYEQLIAYARAYADSIPAYTAADGKLVDVASSIGAVLNGFCDAINSGSAAARGPVVPAAQAPSHVAQPRDPSAPSRFMATADPQCADWSSTLEQTNSDPAVITWAKEDSSIPASSWSDPYKAENQAVLPVLNRVADSYDHLGQQGANPVTADLGTLAAQYLRALIAALPSYTAADTHLYTVFANVAGVVRSACAAAGAS